MLKKEFMKFRGDNASKVKFNEWCDKNYLEDHTDDIKEVDTSKKIASNVIYL